MSLTPEILIVDDEPLVCRTLAEILQTGGFSVDRVGRGKDAIEQAQRRFYNVVLLDLNLPDMPGLEVVEHLQHYSPKTEVVIITGYATLKSALEALERGVMAYVEKPVRPNQLVSTINGVLEKQRLKLENERMIRQLSALLYFAQDITSELELEELLRRIVIRATELANAEQGFVALLEDDALRLKEYWDGHEWQRQQAHWRRGEDVPGHVWLTQQPHLSSDADHDKLITPAVRSMLRLKSCLCTPIIDTVGHFIGVLEVGNKVGREPFTREDLSMLQALSRQAAIAIENARLYQRQKEEAEISTSLLRVAESLSHFTDLDELLNIASEITPSLLGCDQFGLFLFDRTKEMFYGAKMRGLVSHQDREFLAMRVNRGQAGVLNEVWQKCNALVVRAAAKTQLINPAYVGGLDLTGWLLIPLMAKGEVIGIMALNSSAGSRPFTSRDIKIATGVANQLAIAIENTNLFSEVSAQKTALQRLSMRLTNVLEEERARISRELHDGIGQVLSGMLIGLDVLEEKVPVSLVAVRRGLRQVKMLTEKTLDELRRLSHDLRPSLLDDLGLLDAVQWLADYLAERCGWTMQVIVDADFPRLPPEVETALFRISQEALNNIKTHAAASEVTIRLSQQDELIQLEIEDNGRGFDPVAMAGNHYPERGIGLLSMQERATALGGKLFIEAEVGKGTKLKVAIPWQDVPARPPLTQVDEVRHLVGD
ncbi:MAG: GAF domain-containing protein [Acidobacteria bacterium]|nr:GAF domain-containing protein [Acidobacteriota bacterium]